MSDYANNINQLKSATCIVRVFANYSVGAPSHPPTFFSIYSAFSLKSADNLTDSVDINVECGRHLNRTVVLSCRVHGS